MVLARRWAVERTLRWLSRVRRLNRDHERRPDHHTQMVWWSGLITLTRKLAKEHVHWSSAPGAWTRGRTERAPLTQQPPARLERMGSTVRARCRAAGAAYRRVQPRDR